MRRNRTNLFLGLLLVLIGVWLVITRQVPAIQHWLDNNLSGAVWTIAAGVLVLFIGLITGAPGMAVPASIIAGIGGILYYQNATGDYESWSYMWALIPGFVGVGTILAGLLGDNTRNSLGRGLNLIVISAALFLIFAGFFGGLSILGNYGPAIILIALGVYILVRGLLRSGSRGPDETR
jgi:peptidoglycan/LPS O-acetylase OafA/YrhL